MLLVGSVWGIVDERENTTLSNATVILALLMIQLQTDEFELRFICLVVLSLSRTKMVASGAFFAYVFSSVCSMHYILYFTVAYYSPTKTSGHVKVQLANNLHHLFLMLCCIAKCKHHRSTKTLLEF